VRAPPEQARSRRRIAARVLGLVATSALLGVAVAIGLLVTGGAGDDSQELTPSAAVAATPEPTPEASRRERADGPRMSRRARAARKAAVADVNAQGYTPVSLKSYQPDRRLRVLIGAPTGDKGGGRRAFFFVDRRYVGTDTADTSARISLDKTRGERWVTLTYRLYAAGDRACCPRGERAKERYEWDGSAVRAGDPLPQPELRLKRR
jgi:hypothetical protein